MMRRVIRPVLWGSWLVVRRYHGVACTALELMEGWLWLWLWQGVLAFARGWNISYVLGMECLSQNNNVTSVNAIRPCEYRSVNLACTLQYRIPSNNHTK